MATSDDDIRLPLRNMQIITFALAAGVVIFMAIVGFLGLRDGANRAPEQLPIITIIAFAMLAADFAMTLIVPRQIVAAGIQRIAQSRVSGDLKMLLGLRQTSLIITLALFEGPAFVGCVAFLIERQVYALAVPILALVGMAMHFPTENSLRDWLERHGRQVLELRQT